MSELTTLVDAITELQVAHTKLAEALEALNTHNTDEDAHPAIQEQIDELRESDTMYTREEIVTLITNQLVEHEAKDFKTAHPGWEEYDAELTETLSTITGSITSIKNRLDNIENDEETTDLQKLLQAVEDKYAPILTSLQNAFKLYEENNQEELAAQTKQTIADTLDQKRDELMKVMEDWQKEHNTESSETEM
jgi:predicted negative regulator of RcsB-dependent stress response